MEVRKKYLEEQLLFENYISYYQTLNTLSPSVGGVGGPPSSPDPSPDPYDPYNPTIYYNARLSSPPEGSFTNFSGSKTLFAHFPAST